MEELIVRNGDVQLAASYSPAGDTAIVALHGAGEGTREFGSYTHLHELLPPAGIGVVTFDRRGEGESKTWRCPTARSRPSTTPSSSTGSPDERDEPARRPLPVRGVLRVALDQPRLFAP